VQDVAHHDHVGFRQCVNEEVSSLERDPVRELVAGDEILERGSNEGKVEADAAKMRMGLRHNDRQFELDPGFRTIG
jgi:hypothetical protein